MKEYICHCGEVKELSDSTDIEFQICPKCARMGEWEELTNEEVVK